MKNYAVLSFDESCGLRGLFKKDTFPYPVAYTDGVVSRLKSKMQGRTPWGIVIKGYIVSINLPEQKMEPFEAEQYCKDIVFSGMMCQILPRGVLIIMMKNLERINQMMITLGKKPFEAIWYMAENDNWLDPSLGYDPHFAGVHPHYLYDGVAYFYSDYEAGSFFPAVKL